MSSEPRNNVLSRFFVERGIEFFPLRQRLRGYSWKGFTRDARAGFNVSLIDFPQGMAYALIAGLPFQFGIYASATAALIGPLLASSRYVVLGPTNAIAVLTLSAFLAAGINPSAVPAALPLLLLLTGIFLIVGAFFRVASFIQYISRSVVTGYITAAACLIVANQVKTVLGFHIEPAATVLHVVVRTIHHWQDIHFPALFLGLGTAAFFLTLKRFFPSLPHVAITLILASVAAAVMEHFNFHVEHLASLPAGHWPLTMPTLSPDTTSKLASGALAIAFLSLLESSSIAQTLAARSGDRINLNQHMLSMGVANIACSFTSAMPISGSLTRSALNFESGAVSPVSSMVSGSILAVGVLCLGPYLGAIPKSSLAVLIVCVGLALINRQAIRMVTRTTLGDAAVFWITFGSGLFFPLDTAIYLGTGASIALFFRQAAKPELRELDYNQQGQLAALGPEVKRSDPEISIVHVEGNLFFAAAELFQEQIRRFAEDPNLQVIILRLKNAHHLDGTAVLAFEDLIRSTREKGRSLIVSGARADVVEICERTGLIDVIGRENFFAEDPQNPTISVRDALKRAKAVIGDRKSTVSVYPVASAETTPPATR